MDHAITIEDVVAIAGVVLLALAGFAFLVDKLARRGGNWNL